MSTFIDALSQQSSLINMDTPHYFLGIEHMHNTYGLFLSQHKFIKDILKKFDMTEAKPSPTPLTPIVTLTINDDTPTIYATQYRSIIGSLQYLILTILDLSFSIN
uniref:Reverse transcriptase Ty1/copia-type domain-containing protein n=1 Tax=Cajanus cajan TaxID=3821 RepID=A0A151TUJ2_CAJCA|nr:hypothetical protein KK1_009924 [Cajanus cajan]